MSSMSNLLRYDSWVITLFYVNVFGSVIWWGITLFYFSQFNSITSFLVSFSLWFHEIQNWFSCYFSEQFYQVFELILFLSWSDCSILLVVLVTWRKNKIFTLLHYWFVTFGWLNNMSLAGHRFVRRQVNNDIQPMSL